MAYVSPLASIVDLLQQPLPGNPYTKSFRLFNQNAVTGPTAFVVPVSGTLVTPDGIPVILSRGWVRARFSQATGTTPVVSALTVTATDGTNTVAIPIGFFTSPTLSATTEIEYLAPFFSERNLNKFTFTVTMTGITPTAQGDFEVVGMHV